jgi:ABC-2 type transport system ATP-binding protein
MSEPVVDVRGLTKVFKSLRAVDDLSFQMHPGEILGVLGPNGAGKTTLIHMLLGLTTPTSGEISVFGLDLRRHREQIVQQVNFSSTYISMPNSLKVVECLRIFARLYGVADREHRINEVLEMFEISDQRRKLVRNLSSGQRSRLYLAKAFINRPRILFLDEPTASLDPDIAEKTRRLLTEIKRDGGISILYTSHNMKEMQELSDRILFLRRGRAIADGRPEDVISRFPGEDLEEVFLNLAREGEL